MNMTLLAPKQADIDGIGKTPLCFHCFAPQVLEFIEQFSQRLMKSTQARQHPELIALGFWLRKGHIQSLRAQLPSGLIKPRGWVMHFTPANVDTMFVYSWICSLLMGNHNVIRVATAASESKDVLLEILNQLFAEPQFVSIARNNLFVHYDKHSAHSANLSLLADARVMWGGDDSVTAIRALPCKPRCVDIGFADRYSATLVNGDALHSDTAQTQWAQAVLKDSQPYDQQACSSPRILFWLGSQHALAASLDKLNELSRRQNSAITQRNNHLVYQQLVCAQQEGVTAYELSHICALQVPKLTVEQRLWHTGEGMWLIYAIESLDTLGEQLDEKLQTLSYWGVDKGQLLKLLENPSISGLDRVVPVGQALDFSPVWDGFDVFSQLCRRIVLE